VGVTAEAVGEEIEGPVLIPVPEAATVCVVAPVLALVILFGL
jgi:hypothetical protein